MRLWLYAMMRLWLCAMMRLWLCAMMRGAERATCVPREGGRGAQRARAPGGNVQDDGPLAATLVAWGPGGAHPRGLLP
jgi:hypothetical protein